MPVYLGKEGFLLDIIPYQESVFTPVAPVFLVKRSVSLCHVLDKVSSHPHGCRPMQKLHLESQKTRICCELAVIVHVPVCSTVLKEELSDFPQEICQIRAGWIGAV